MKKSINAWCFDPTLSLDECFKLAKESGFDAFEVNMVEGETGLHMGLDESGYKAIKDISEKYKLPISSVSTGLHWIYPLSDNDPVKRERGKEVVRKCLDAAAYFGCDTILLVPGTVTSEVSYTDAYERSYEAIKDLSSYAEAKKVTIGVENVWNKFLLSPMEMAAFIDKINSPYVKSYFDAGNVLLTGYPDNWVKILGNRIAKVHIKDFDGTIGNITGFKNLLQGDLDWKKLMASLREVGYDCYITAELSPYNTNPSQLIKDTSVAMDYILSL